MRKDPINGPPIPTNPCKNPDKPPPNMVFNFATLTLKPGLNNE